MHIQLPLPQEMRGQGITYARQMGEYRLPFYVWAGWEITQPPFAYEIAKDNGSGRRLFNVIINGQPVLANYEVYKEAPGQHKVVVAQCNSVADGTGDITIQFATVLASATISGIEIISLNGMVTRINCGGDAVGAWQADTGYRGGTRRIHQHAIDTLGVIDPAPLEVYHTLREGVLEQNGEFSYILRGFEPHALYVVRLHFIECDYTGVHALTLKYTLSGCGEFTLDGASYPITAGCATLATSRHAVQYRAVSTDTPWEHISLLINSAHFTDSLEDILYSLGPTPHIPADHPVMQTLCGIFQLLWRQEAIDGMHLQEQLYHLILLLHKLAGDNANYIPIHRFIAQNKQDIKCIPQEKSDFINVMLFLKEHLAETITIADIARLMRMSPTSLHRFFHRHANCAPMQFLINLRLQRSCELLRGTTWSIVEIASRCGFVDARYFSRTFHHQLGVTPSQYRRQSTAGEFVEE